MATFHLCFFFVTASLANLSLTVPYYCTRLLLMVYDKDRNLFHPVEAGESVRGNAFRIDPAYEECGRLPISVLTSLFFFLSFLFHSLNATLLREFYEEQLSFCRTPTRWLEYSLSAPTMFVVIAYSLGVRSIELLVAVLFLTMITMPFGLWTEENARPRSPSEWERPFWFRIYPWLLGHIPQIGAWTVVLTSFYGGVEDMSRVPWFVHLILWGELVLFWSFGVASFVSQLGPPRMFYRGELLFQFLSLVSKGFLGILLLSNVLMLSRFDEIYQQHA